MKLCGFAHFGPPQENGKGIKAIIAQRAEDGSTIYSAKTAAELRELDIAPEIEIEMAIRILDKTEKGLRGHGFGDICSLSDAKYLSVNIGKPNESFGEYWKDKIPPRPVSRMLWELSYDELPGQCYQNVEQDGYQTETYQRLISLGGIQASITENQTSFSEAVINLTEAANESSYVEVTNEEGPPANVIPIRQRPQADSPSLV